MATGSVIAALPSLLRQRGRLQFRGGIGTSDPPGTGRPLHFTPGLAGRSGGAFGDWGYDVSWLAQFNTSRACLSDFSQFALAGTRRLGSLASHEFRILFGPQLSFVDKWPWGGGLEVGLLHRWRAAGHVTLSTRLAYLPTYFGGGNDVLRTNHPIRGEIEFAIPTNAPWHLTTSVTGGTNRNGRFPRARTHTEPVEWYARPYLGLMVGVRTSQMYESDIDEP